MDDEQVFWKEVIKHIETEKGWVFDNQITWNVGEASLNFIDGDELVTVKYKCYNWEETLREPLRGI